MQKSQTEQALVLLHELRASWPEVEGSSLVTLDGLLIVWTLPMAFEEDRLTPRLAAAFTLAQRLAEEHTRGAVEHLCIQSMGGFVCLLPVGEETVLMLLLAGDCRLEALIAHAMTVAHELEKLFE